ncbi:hypothetical protein F5146DRAFT_1003996 [Armillaria mellea]|nr:hypothetical protein F5146DRAFT_1003996 [Armillaria mellea]
MEEGVVIAYSGLDISLADNLDSSTVGFKSFHISWAQPRPLIVVSLGVKDIISLIVGDWFWGLGELYNRKLYSGLSGMGDGGVKRSDSPCQLRTGGLRDVEVIWRGGEGKLDQDKVIVGGLENSLSWSGIAGRFLPMQWELLTRFEGVVGTSPPGRVLIKGWDRVGDKDIKREGWVSDYYEESSIDQKAVDSVIESSSISLKLQIPTGGEGHKEQDDGEGTESGCKFND